MRFYPLYNTIPRHEFAREGLVVAYVTRQDRTQAQTGSYLGGSCIGK
jgi:hypothetical protein